MDIGKMVANSINKYKDRHDIEDNNKDNVEDIDKNLQATSEPNSEVAVSQNTEIQDNIVNKEIAEIVNKELSDFSGGVNKVIKDYIPDAGKDMNEQAKDVIDVLSIGKAVEDDKFVSKLGAHKQEELETRAINNKKKEDEKGKEADVKLQQADFSIYAGIASYAGIKRSLPSTMQKILFIPLGIIIGIFLFVFGSIASIINIVLDCINAIMEKFATLAESSKRAIKSLSKVAIILGGLAIIYIIIKSILMHYGIWFN